MSDYIYMLESHLSTDQNRVVEAVQAAASQANVNLFLTGGAMRDMLAGFRIRDLDFSLEGNAMKVAKTPTPRPSHSTRTARAWNWSSPPASPRRSPCRVRRSTRVPGPSRK